MVYCLVISSMAAQVCAGNITKFLRSCESVDDIREELAAESSCALHCRPIAQLLP